ncbi:MAG: hypothetical protein JSR45_03100 [Proteobacteria bacterium]|nr:hypothetical protein [Pseudomonadota bacterium]
MSESPTPPPVQPRPRRNGLGLVLLLVILLGFLAFVVWGFLKLWKMGGDTQMSIHGWIALGIAFVVTGLLGGGLMWLAFYSSRKGWDDQVGTDEDAEG